MNNVTRWTRRVGVGGLLLLLSACGNTALTLDNYDRLEPGMTRAEVEAVLGSPSECAGALMIANCRWGGEQRFIQAQFIDGKALSFQYQGLK